MTDIPTYRRVRQYVLGLLEEHPDTEVRIMSERELAMKFGVSRTTVRNALDHLLRDGWLHVKPGLGMFLNAERMRDSTHATRKSYKVLLVFGDGSGCPPYLDGFLMRMLASAIGVFEPLPVKLHLITFAGAKAGRLDELLLNEPDGILWFRPPQSVDGLVAAARREVPVCVAGAVPSGDRHCVTMDYRRAGEMAAAWFLDRGRTRALFVGHGGGVRGEVHRGWLEEHRSRGVEPGPELCLDYSSQIAGRLEEALKAKAADGIFTFGSEFAAVDDALAASGQDLPVMFDGAPSIAQGAKTVPAARLMTSTTAWMSLAAERLYKLMSEPGFVTRELVLEPELITTQDMPGDTTP